MSRLLKLAVAPGVVMLSFTTQYFRAKPSWAEPTASSQAQFVPLANTSKQPSVRRHAMPPPPRVGPTQLGDPLPGLSTAELAAFAAGQVEFKNVETVASGLGPIFNDSSCVACHFSGATGGASSTTVTRFGRTVNGIYDPLTALGGSLRQAKAIDPAALEVVPPEANVIAHRESTPLFGLGLIEAIPDAAIQQNSNREHQGRANNDDVHPEDGIDGHVALITDVVSGKQRVGRFGWKAQQATLLAFAGDAYLNEMGITNRFFPTENAPNGDAAKLAAFDHVADPEDTVDPDTGRSDIDAAADFIRLLAPPPQLPLSASSSTGSMIFHDLNCAACHTPTMVTGPSAIASLDHRPAHLYSDLLLHDMGALNDGIAQAAASPYAMRTPPLWGLRASAPYLHDGRAATVDQAIREHDGEAAGARDRYTRLSPAQQQQLLDFLGTL